MLAPADQPAKAQKSAEHRSRWRRKRIPKLLKHGIMRSSWQRISQRPDRQAKRESGQTGRRRCRGLHRRRRPRTDMRPCRTTRQSRQGNRRVACGNRVQALEPSRTISSLSHPFGMPSSNCHTDTAAKRIDGRFSPIIWHNCGQLVPQALAGRFSAAPPRVFCAPTAFAAVAPAVHRSRLPH